MRTISKQLFELAAQLGQRGDADTRRLEDSVRMSLVRNAPEYLDGFDRRLEKLHIAESRRRRKIGPAPNLEWSDAAATFKEYLRAIARQLQEHRGRGGRKPNKGPAWKRLRIRRQRGGDDLAELDGKSHRLKGKSADFLQMLKDERGDLILARTLTATLGKRADHVYKTLPRVLQRVVEKPGKRGRGYRML